MSGGTPNRDVEWFETGGKSGNVTPREVDLPTRKRRVGCTDGVERFDPSRVSGRGVGVRRFLHGSDSGLNLSDGSRRGRLAEERIIGQSPTRTNRGVPIPETVHVTT